MTGRQCVLSLIRELVIRRRLGSGWGWLGDSRVVIRGRSKCRGREYRE